MDRRKFNSTLLKSITALSFAGYLLVGELFASEPNKGSFSKPAGNPPSDPDDECPKWEPLAGLCDAIFERTEDLDEDSPNFYMYQTKIYGAACLKGDEEPEVLKAGVQEVWKKFGRRLSCDSLRFSIPNGSLLMLAIETRWMEAIEDFIMWEVDLNRIDFERTPLDHAIYLKNKYSNHPLTARSFEVIEEKLRKAGAKKRSELP